jgi:hypothetical protein
MIAGHVAFENRAVHVAVIAICGALEQKPLGNIKVLPHARKLHRGPTKVVLGADVGSDPHFKELLSHVQRGFTGPQVRERRASFRSLFWAVLSCLVLYVFAERRKISS